MVKARLLCDDLSRAQRNLSSVTHAAGLANNTKSDWESPLQSRFDVRPPGPGQVQLAFRNAQYANTQQSAAQSQVDSLQAQLAELKIKAETAGHNQDRAADRLVHQLHEASNVGIHNKKWYQKVADWAGKAWDWTVTISKWVVAVAGILVLFFGGPLAWIVLAAALIVLADTITKFAQGKVGWGDLLFAVLDCIPVAGKLAMLAKAGEFMRGYGMALKVAKAEKQFATLTKVWRMGIEEDGYLGQLKGFKKLAFVFAKNEGKNTVQDYLNGGTGNVKKNALGNAVGNAIGLGVSPFVDKGFSKVPGLLFHNDLISRKDYGRLAMHLSGKTQLGKSVIGTTKSFVVSVTKQTTDSVFFGGSFDAGGLALGTAGGYGDSGLGYIPGIGPAKTAFAR